MFSLAPPIVPTALLLTASNLFFNMGNMNYLYAGLCLLGAACFIFRG